MNTTTLTDHLRFEARPESHTIEFHAHGKLTRADYDRVLPPMEALVRAWPVVNFYVVLDDFHGWEAGAAWEDLKFDVRHGGKFGRAAIVGESAAERWGTRISNWVLPGEIRYFEPGEEAAARAWVTGA